MLRRRIFSSAMASVMALSSVAVVANAEDTQMKTKADLEKLVNETYGSDYRVDELSEFGTVSAENMLDAIEHGEAVLADADSTDDDATVAYMMIEAARKRLVKYTAEELKALMAKYKSAYDSNNILNEELQDNIYTPETYEFFAGKYENADLYVTSTSSVDITSAYEELEDAYNKLSKIDEVTKSAFRAVMKEYEGIIAKQYDYEDWRRGSNADWVAHAAGDTHWQTQKVGAVPYATVWGAVMSVGDNIKAAYDEIDAIKGLSKTTLTTIVDGYKLAKEAVAEYNGWKADDSNRATKAGVNQLLDQYHSCLVADYATTTAETLYGLISGNVESGDTSLQVSHNSAVIAKDNWGATDWDVSGSSWNVKMAKTVYIAVDKEGFWLGTADAVNTTATKSTELAKLADENFYRWMPISKGSSYDIVKLIPIDAANVTEAGDEPLSENPAFDLGDTYPCFSYDVTNVNTGVSLAQAYAVAMDYLNGDKEYDLPENIDTAGVVVDDPKEGRVAKGNSKEWALVYRYLKYALEDKYAAVAPAGATYTRADVKALLEDCYILAEETGDAAIFNITHVKLVDARKKAQEWLADTAADKKYKDNVGTKDYDPSTVAYTALKDAYDALNKEYQALKYSFDDVQNKIAEVAGMIDDGDLEASADLLKALDETAYCLSVVADEVATSAGANFDNPGFDVDRVLQINNRLITNTGDAVDVAGLGGSVKCAADNNPTHYALLNAYNALVKAVDDQIAPDVKVGDVNGDGNITSADAAMILKSLVGMVTVDEKVADYNADGTVTSADASAILKAIVNQTV